MHFFTLPFRNILRNGRRSIITLSAIVVGALTILLFGGYTNSITQGLQTGFVRQMGHLQIQRKGYFLVGNGSPAEYGIKDYKRIIDDIARDSELKDMIVVMTPVMHLFGIAGNFEAGVSKTVSGVGVVPSDQNRMRSWNDYQFPGSARPIALLENQENSVVIGQGVARTLRLCNELKVPNCPPAAIPAKKKSGQAAPVDVIALADDEHAADSKQPTENQNAPRIELLAATSQGTPNVASVEVVAAENQGIKEMDDMFVAMPLGLAQRLVYGNDEPQVTSIVVQLKHTGQIGAAKARLTAIFDRLGLPLEAIDFTTLNPTYDQIRGLFGSIFFFIALLMSTIILFSVANTMSMAVMERTVEIGTLRAMGLCRRGTAQIFLMEGLYIGLLGAGAGTLAAMLVAAGVNSASLTWTPPSQVEPIPLVIHLAGDYLMILGTCIGLTVAAALSGLLPALRAARMPVVDSLRHT
ncbi:MAG: ABC transporter permease [Burkholderiales bacterium]